MSYDGANYVPPMKGYSGQGAFRFWCQTVLPIVYDDSLSYYELLNKVVNYLNNTISDVANVESNVQALHDAFVQLEDYVNKYFENLDVSEEINTKLDEMATTGELSSIIAPIVLGVATPVFVNNVSEMTDTSRIYILTTTGYAYVWNGVNWVNTGINYVADYVNYIQVAGTVSDNTDLDTVTNNGIWNLSGGRTYPNAPDMTFGILECYNVDNVIYQIAYDGNYSTSNYGTMFFRIRVGGEWKAWKKISSKAIIPDGTIADGSNLNNVTQGYYYFNSSYSYTNAPSGATSGVFSSYENIGDKWQTLICSNGDIYIRRTISNVWQSWNKNENVTQDYHPYSLDTLGTIPNNTDLDDLTQGVYGFIGVYSYTHAPLTNAYGVLSCYENIGTIYEVLNCVDGNVYIRYRVSGTWTDWANNSPTDFHPHSLDTIGTIANNYDLDDLAQGVYGYIGVRTYLNAPDTNSYGVLTCFDNIGGIYQTLVCVNGDIFVRYRASGVWSDWTVNTSADLHPNSVDTISDIATNTDLDNLAQGVYGYNHLREYVNAPNCSSYGVLACLEHLGRKFQILTAYNGDYFIRYTNNAVWQSWKSYFNDPWGVDKNIVYKGLDVVIYPVEGSYFSTSSGAISPSQNFCRSNLFRVTPRYGIYYSDESDTHNHYIMFYGADYSYISYKEVNTNSNTDVIIVPDNAVYAGFGYNHGADTAPDTFTVKLVNGENILGVNENVSNNNTVMKVVNKLRKVNTMGSISSDYKSFVIPNPNFKYVFVNANFAHQLICKERGGSQSEAASYETISPIGRVYALPENTEWCALNIWQAPNCYVTFLYSTDDLETMQKITTDIPMPRICGKKIAVIGDSITWYDGHDRAGETRLKGWQAYLRMCGANVQSYGYNGYPYATNTSTGSIAQSILTDEPDFSDIDILIMMAGSNDLRLELPIGSDNTDWTTPNVTPDTVVGAIGAIINYARTQNDEIEIFLCTTLPSEANGTYATTTQINNATSKCSEFWGCPLIDTRRMFNGKPFDPTYDVLTVDGTHPTGFGMNRIGRCIAAYVNSYMTIIG